MKAAVFVILTVSLFLAAPCRAAEPVTAYAVAVLPTPVLNTPDFDGVFGGPDGQTLRQDGRGLIRAVEFVALPGTPFRIVERVGSTRGTVYRVTTTDYPYPSSTGYFIDGRFVRTTADLPPARVRHLPTGKEIIARLLAARGSRYVWGGNLRGGIPEMLDLFPPRDPKRLSPRESDLWQLRGVDCSGLLYEATDGFTPRNTSALVDFGKKVPIAGRTAEEIARRMEPLDLIVWDGHVVVVIDGGRVIESRLGVTGRRDGVQVTPLLTALRGLMEGKAPVDDYKTTATRGVKGFVVRRWYPQH